MVPTTAMGFLWLFLAAITAGGGWTLGAGLMGKIIK